MGTYFFMIPARRAAWVIEALYLKGPTYFKSKSLGVLFSSRVCREKNVISAVLDANEREFLGPYERHYEHSSYWNFLKLEFLSEDANL